MKKLLKKIAVVITTAAIAVSAMVITATTASAKSVFDGATKMEQMEYYKVQIPNAEGQRVYKVDIPKDGELMFRWGVVENTASSYAKLYDSKAAKIESWYLNYSNREHKCNGLKAGTYYLEIAGTRKNATINDLYFTFTPNKKPTISLKVTIKKGTSLQLGSVVENYDGKVTWTSTKKTVATVSSTGKVTAKKAGTTTIRAQLDSGEYVQIKLTVSSK